MAFGFGGGGGFSLGGALGGLSLLGSAFVEFQAQREEASAAREQQKKLQREQQAADIQARREQERMQQERRQQVGAIRARLAGQGLDLSSGSARRLIDLTSSRFDQDEEDAAALRQLEEQGFTSAIGSARRARSVAGVNQFLLPSLSLLGGFGSRS